MLKPGADVLHSACTRSASASGNGGICGFLDEPGCVISSLRPRCLLSLSSGHGPHISSPLRGRGREWCWWGGGSRPSQLPFFPTGVGCCARQVLVPEGPLYRVAGTAVSIPCNVTGYEGPARQDFEWFLYRPEAPEAALGIVSTRDPRFSYAVFGPRVTAGEVQVQRVRDDAAVLNIARLQAQDAGVYECYTPSTDARYLGSYSGKVELRGTGLWGESQSGEELMDHPLGFAAEEPEVLRG